MHLRKTKIFLKYLQKIFIRAIEFENIIIILLLSGNNGSFKSINFVIIAKSNFYCTAKYCNDIVE